MTQLPNRFQFVERLSEPATRRACASGKLAIIFLDVDGFKNVNDTIGHAGGDDLICQIADRLAASLPKNSFLARVGGDEFNILVIGDDIISSVEKTAQKCFSEIQRDFLVKGRIFRVSVSIGYAIAKHQTTSCEELVRQADVAMYQAKANKAGEPVVYREEYESSLFRNRKIDQALRAALTAGEVKVHYQPIVHSQTGQMELAEALVYWNSTEFGRMSPEILHSCGRRVRPDQHSWNLCIPSGL